jgi:hypothetical protein
MSPGSDAERCFPWPAGERSGREPCMRLLVIVVLALLSACNRLPTDPPPPASSGDLPVAPPGALGAHAAQEGSPWTSAERGDGGSYGDSTDAGPGATPAPGMSPGPGVDAGVAL